MRQQSTESACGFCATANALKALGLHEVDEATVARWVDKVRRAQHPGLDGLDEWNLGRAVSEAAPKRMKLVVRAVHVRDSALAVLALRGALEAGSVAVLAVDPVEHEGAYGASHWISACGRVGDRFLLADSADTEVVLSLSPSQLLLRWEIPGDSPSYYMLVISTTRSP